MSFSSSFGFSIEWEAFDYHSGLHEVHWKLFDNYTKNVVVHGQSHEPPQGETKVHRNASEFVHIVNHNLYKDFN